MKENPNVFRSPEVVGVEKALLDKLTAIEKKNPKFFKDKPGTLKNDVILTYPSKDNDYAFHFALRPNTELTPAVQKKVLEAFEEIKADLAARKPNHAHPPAGTQGPAASSTNS